MSVGIREATEHDLAAILELSNALIPTTTTAWTERLETIDERAAWFEAKQARGWPVLVADADGEVVGFASYGAFRDTATWPGYRFTVEHTVHVREDHWGRGVGRQLVASLLDRARASGVHVVVAAVDGENVGSIRFHERLGFIEVGRMPETGTKFGRWLDLVLLQIVL